MKNLDLNLQYPGESYNGPYTTSYLEEDLVPSLKNGLLSAVKGDISVEALFQCAVSSKYPVPAIKYLLDQTFRSYRFLNLIVLPNEKLPKKPIGTITRGTHPLHLKDRIDEDNREWLIGHTFVTPIDPATRLLGYMKVSAFFNNQTVDEKYYAKKVQHTSVETMKEIEAVLKPWAMINVVLRDLISHSRYESHIGLVQFSYSVGSYNAAYQNIVTPRI